MRNYLEIDCNSFNYELKDEQIAKFPLDKRNHSKLLVYKENEIISDNFFNIDNHIESNNLLVFNNTKVIHARMFFKKETGSKIEIFCLEPYSPNDYALSFSQTNKCLWTCLVGNAKKWKNDKLYKKGFINNKETTISANLIEIKNGNYIVEFEWNNNFSFSEIIDNFGEIPIPPYLNRENEEIDNDRYQTVYSKINGSVAAPTAGLHFSDEEFKKLQSKKIATENLTLHVGAGTFKPLNSKTTGEHSMHCEHFIISKVLIEKLIKHYPNIIAVGTTSARTLESLVVISRLLNEKGINSKIHVSQWEAYEDKYNNDTLIALQNILNYFNDNNISNLSASTSIMIVPGYKFKIISGIITNFHQPQSTLIALVSALVGDKWKKIYNYALSNNYRFLSYGDSSLLYRQ